MNLRICSCGGSGGSYARWGRCLLATACPHHACRLPSMGRGGRGRSGLRRSRRLTFPRMPSVFTFDVYQGSRLMFPSCAVRREESEEGTRKDCCTPSSVSKQNITYYRCRRTDEGRTKNGRRTDEERTFPRVSLEVRNRAPFLCSEKRAWYRAEINRVGASSGGLGGVGVLPPFGCGWWRVGKRCHRKPCYRVACG